MSQIGAGLEVSPEKVFDNCHTRFLECKAILEAKIGVIDPAGSCRSLWRPDRSARLAEYAADFAIVGRKALRKTFGDDCVEARLFHHRFVDDFTVREAKAALNLGNASYRQHENTIRRVVGAALLAEGLWPVGSYFTERGRKTEQ